jgi:hypothetical protein
LPATLARQLALREGRLTLDSAATPLGEAEARTLHEQCVAEGLLEPTGEADALRLTAGTLLHHQDELRGTLLLLTPPKVE